MLKLLLLGLMCLAAIGRSHGQGFTARSELPKTFNFEGEQIGALPFGWAGGPSGTIFMDRDIVHSGRWSARIQRDSDSPETFTALSTGSGIDFDGTTLEWRGFLRTENVSGFAGLWIREGGESGTIAFDNMERQQVNGTRDWIEYSIRLPLRPDARYIVFGALLSGTGKVWVDDLQLLVDGKPVSDVPQAERFKTILDLDQEFDRGSRITITELSPLQIDNLATLAKVWGFLKYHHPAAAGGQWHWDYELFRIMPKIIAAASRDAALGAMREWVQGLGRIPACSECVALRVEDLHLKPDLAWIDDHNAIGPELSATLRNVYRNRRAGGQFYVSQVPNLRNPVFERELPYPHIAFPDPGYQLLALFRFWNIVQYWFPYRNMMDRNWNDVLVETIPRLALAKDKDSYQLEVLRLVGAITDTHADLKSLPARSRPPVGDCQLPIVLRFIQGKAVVSGYSHATAGPDTGLKIGDVIESLNRQRIQHLVDRLRPYYPASNNAAQLRDIASGLTRGDCTKVKVTVPREAESPSVSPERMLLADLNASSRASHDLPGETFRLLSEHVAYLKLSSVKESDAARYVERAKGTRGLIIDIRNYPSAFMVFALGESLVNKPTPFVRFTRGNLANPGAFYWDASLSLTPRTPHYAGKVVILVDEVSQSASEYTAMALRTPPGAVVIGSMTAGADGNVSPIALPGGLLTRISGIGIFYPDKRPTQRIGIVPDVEVMPTIAGIRAGRDEVLEEGLRQILGRDAPQEEILKLAKP